MEMLLPLLTIPEWGWVVVLGVWAIVEIVKDYNDDDDYKDTAKQDVKG